MEADDRQVTTAFTVQPLFHHRYSTNWVSSSSANDKVRCGCTFAEDGNASWYSVFRVPIVEWRLDCRHLTVVGPPWYRPQVTEKFLDGRVPTDTWNATQKEIPVLEFSYWQQHNNKNSSTEDSPATAEPRLQGKSWFLIHFPSNTCTKGIGKFFFFQIFFSENTGEN